MAFGYANHHKLARLLMFALLTAAGALFAAGDYDVNHDKKLESPNQEQIQQALKAGEKFNAWLTPEPPVKPPMAVIPESYTTETEVYPASPPPEEEYDSYWWRWGPQLFWPCARFDPFQRYSFYLSIGRHHERDRDDWLGLFDMWCPPLHGHVRKHPHQRGEP